MTLNGTPKQTDFKIEFIYQETELDVGRHVWIEDLNKKTILDVRPIVFFQPEKTGGEWSSPIC